MFDSLLAALVKLEARWTGVTLGSHTTDFRGPRLGCRPASASALRPPTGVTGVELPTPVPVPPPPPPAPSGESGEGGEGRCGDAPPPAMGERGGGAPSYPCGDCITRAASCVSRGTRGDACAKGCRSTIWCRSKSFCRATGREREEPAWSFTLNATPMAPPQGDAFAGASMQAFQRVPLGETFDGPSVIQEQFKEWRLLWVRPKEGAAAHGATAAHNVMCAVASDDNWEAAKRQFSVENDCGEDPGGWLCDAKHVIDSLSENTKLGTAGGGRYPPLPPRFYCSTAGPGATRFLTACL